MSDERPDVYCRGKRVATIDELSAAYGRDRILERLARERAQAARQAGAPPLDATPGQPRPHGHVTPTRRARVIR